MNTCSTCIHWMIVRHGNAKSVRGIDGTVKQCTALPPRGDFHWPRTAENHTCGHWKSAELNPAPAPIEPQLADLLGQVDGKPSARRTRRTH
jgi:hypothetical protein